MKITNDIKIKLFAQYLGCNFIYSGTKDLTEYELNAERLGIIDEEKDYDDIKIILKPLSQISDDDAIEVANIVKIDAIYKGKDRVHRGRMYLFELKLFRSDLYQFLQSKGYDLPHYLLCGKTLKEFGLAIYK